MRDKKSPQKTRHDLLEVLSKQSLESKMEVKFCDTVVKCHLRQNGFFWSDLHRLIPKGHRAKTVKEVIDYLQQIKAA